MQNEYDLYLPTVLENGETVDYSKLEGVKQGLLKRFGGLTDTRHKNTGFWKSGSVVIKDEIVIWRVMSEEGKSGDVYLKEVKRTLEDLLEQDTILIVKRNIEFL